MSMLNRGIPSQQQKWTNTPPYFVSRGKLLFTHRNSHTGFPSVSKLMTMNDLELRNGRYFALCHQIRYLWPNFGANYVIMVVRPILFATENVAQRIWFSAMCDLWRHSHR